MAVTWTKVKLYLGLIKYHAMPWHKMGRKCPASLPGRFITWGKSFHSVGGQLDDLEMRKPSCLYRESNLDFSVLKSLAWPLYRMSSLGPLMLVTSKMFTKYYANISLKIMCIYLWVIFYLRRKGPDCTRVFKIKYLCDNNESDDSSVSGIYSVRNITDIYFFYC
jgi:hypothetical protein